MPSSPTILPGVGAGSAPWTAAIGATRQARATNGAIERRKSTVWSLVVNGGQASEKVPPGRCSGCGTRQRERAWRHSLREPVRDQRGEAPVALVGVRPGRLQPADVHRAGAVAEHRQQPAATLSIGAGP